MELIIIAVAVVAVIVYFGSTLKSTAAVVNNTISTGGEIVNVGLDVAVDTAATYGVEVKLSNAEKRSELANIIEGLEHIVTCNDLEIALKGKAKATA